jgi:hypothetical protein
VVRVEIDAEVLDFIIKKAKWLSEAEALDPQRIGLAISRGAEDFGPELVPGRVSGLGGCVYPLGLDAYPAFWQACGKVPERELWGGGRASGDPSAIFGDGRWPIIL